MRMALECFLVARSTCKQLAATIIHCEWHRYTHVTQVLPYHLCPIVMTQNEQAYQKARYVLGSIGLLTPAYSRY